MCEEPRNSPLVTSQRQATGRPPFPSLLCYDVPRRRGLGDETRRCALSPLLSLATEVISCVPKGVLLLNSVGMLLIYHFNGKNTLYTTSETHVGIKIV